MPKKRFSPKQIVTLLRQIEVSMAQGNAKLLKDFAPKNLQVSNGAGLADLAT